MKKVMLDHQKKKKEDFEFVIHPCKENRVSIDKDGTTFGPKKNKMANPTKKTSI